MKYLVTAQLFWRIALIRLRVERLCLAAWWEAARVKVSWPVFRLAIWIMGKRNFKEVLQGIQRRGSIR